MIIQMHFPQPRPMDPVLLAPPPKVGGGLVAEIWKSRVTNSAVSVICLIPDVSCYMY